MTTEPIVTERSAAALVIRFNRPDRRNAISVQVMEKMLAVFADVDRDPAVRGVIITGGDEYFSAGADLREVPALMGQPGTAVEYMALWRKLHAAIENLSKPVIAAIEGFCLTGGFEMAMACDLRIAGEGSSFGITSAQIGTVPGSGGTQRLPRIVGIANALEILFAADPIDAQHAFRIGLLNKLVARGGALAEAKAWVELYDQRAPLSLKLLKRAVYAGMQMDLADAIEYESFIVTTIYQTKDRGEGINAFLEKRKPRFLGN
jgi:enoyl-CoA hydratase/carnithine racemase